MDVRPVSQGWFICGFRDLLGVPPFGPFKDRDDARATAEAHGRAERLEWFLCEPVRFVFWFPEQVKPQAIPYWRNVIRDAQREGFRRAQFPPEVLAVLGLAKETIEGGKLHARGVRLSDSGQ